jgi:hypothetical protein
MLTLPHLVTAFFYASNAQPEEGSGNIALLSENSVSNINERTLGLTLLSWQVLLLSVAYTNDKTWYNFAFLSLAPFHVAMLVLAILTAHTYNIVFHSILIVFASISWLSIMDVSPMKRIPLIGSVRPAEVQMTTASVSGNKPVKSAVKYAGGGDFGRIAGSHA